MFKQALPTGATALALLLGGFLASALAPSPARASEAGALAEFPIPTLGAPAGITDGPEGNIWFTAYGLGVGEKIGRLTPAGSFSEFSIPASESGTRSIAAGPEGNMWFTESVANSIGRITPAGRITEYPLPSPEAGPNGIAAGPDGNIWFAETALDRIGRITPQGQITEFAVPSAGAGPVGVAEGPDGNMWFTEYGFGFGDRIGRITTSGEVTEFPLPAVKIGSATVAPAPYGIAAGPDGNLWFTENAGDQIGRMTTGGEVTAFQIPTEKARPLGIALGPDGNMWFTEYGEGTGAKVGRITPAGEVSEFSTLTPEQQPGASAPYDITAGPDGNLWFTDYTEGRIGQIGSGAPAAPASPPLVVGNAEATDTQVCRPSLFSAWDAEQPLSNLFSFDGFRWSVEGVEVALGESVTPLLKDVGHKLTCTETATYPPPLLLSDTVTSAARTVIAPPPILTRPHESRSRWSEGKRAGRAVKGRKPPVGTLISFNLNEPVPVDFDFDQRVPGRRVEGECVAQTHRNARARPCEHTVTVATLPVEGQLDDNNVYFQGAITHGKSLKPGRYTLVIAAANTTGTAKPVSLSFTVLQ